MPISLFFDLALMFLIESKRCVRNGVLSLENSQKLHNFKSDKHGVSRMIFYRNRHEEPVLWTTVRYHAPKTTLEIVLTDPTISASFRVNNQEFSNTDFLIAIDNDYLPMIVK